jgi:hypothetical protein
LCCNTAFSFESQPISATMIAMPKMYFFISGFIKFLFCWIEKE